MGNCCGAESITVGATATALNESSSDGCRLLIKNAGPEDVALGGGSVMIGSGYPLAESQSVEVQMQPTGVLYAITAEDDTVIKVLRT